MKPVSHTFLTKHITKLFSKRITSKCKHVVWNCFALARLLNLKWFSQQTTSLHLCRTSTLTTTAIKLNWQHYFMLAYQQQNDFTTELKNLK